MLLFLAGVFSSGGAAVGAAIPDVEVDNTVVSATCYAAQSFGTDGFMRSNLNAGMSSATGVIEGAWLLVGLATSYYIEYEITAGTTFSLDDCGGENTRVQMGSTSLRFNVSRVGDGLKTITVTFKIYDHPSAGNLITSQSVTFTANVTSA